MTQSILFVDNLKKFVKVRAEFLINDGFKVIPAYSSNEAELILQQKQIDLVILDIRLKDDDDPNDKSGFLLAQNKNYQHIPKIMVSSDGSYEMVRTAMLINANNVGFAPSNFCLKQMGLGRWLKL